jgi:hypothetical protein
MVNQKLAILKQVEIQNTVQYIVHYSMQQGNSTKIRTSTHPKKEFFQELRRPVKNESNEPFASDLFLRY